MEKEKEQPEFDINDRGFNAKAWYLKDNKGYALIEISYNDKLLRKFEYPAYKIYNIAAHFSDIVDGELSKNDKERGYSIAGSDGFGGCILPNSLPIEK